MRLTEVFGLAWTQVEMAAMTIRIEDTKSGEPLEVPVTRQFAAILERRCAERERFAGECAGLGVSVRGQWLRPSRRHTASQCAHRRGRRGEIPVPCAA